MAISLVAHAVAQSTGASTGATTGAVDTSGANFLAIVVAHYDNITPTVSDSKGNTWTARTSSVNVGNASVRLFYATNPTVGSGHTFTVSDTNGYASVNGLAFSGMDTSSPYDSAENTNFSSTNVSSLGTGSITPNTSGALLLSGWSTFVAGQASSPSYASGATQVDNAVNVSGQAMGINVGWNTWTSGAVSETLTFGGSTAASAFIAAFKPAAGGASASPNFMTLLGVGA